MWTKQKGFSLIETLISLAIVSVGLLAILKLQLHALQLAQYTQDRTIAILRLQSIAMIRRLNPSNFSELFINWSHENNLYLSETHASVSNNHIRLTWFERVSNKPVSYTIKITY